MIKEDTLSLIDVFGKKVCLYVFRSIFSAQPCLVLCPFMRVWSSGGSSADDRGAGRAYHGGQRLTEGGKGYGAQRCDAHRR